MHIFDTDIQMTLTSDQEMSLRVSDQWSINNIANGGYIMALMAQAMLSGLRADMTPCILTVSYMALCDFKPARILLDAVSTSKHFIRKQARLIQDGQERVRAMATFIDPWEPALPVRYETRPARMPDPEGCTRVPPMPGYTLFDHVDMRLDPDFTGWAFGTPLERSIQQGWIRFDPQRPHDIPAMALFADSFPPCIFASQGMNTWVPTIEFTVNIRQLPQTPWVKGVFESRFVSHSLVEEDGELWDEKGNLVAISRQISKYHPDR